MPAPEQRSEVLVGLFIFIGLLLLGGLILQFGRFGERWRGHYDLTVTFDDASGLIKGSEVRMGGAPIGRVSTVPALNDEVRVEVELAIDDRVRIPENSVFSITSGSLLGDKLIVISPPAEKTGVFLKPGARIQGAGLTGLDAIQDNAVALSHDVIRILSEAETTLKKVDGAVDDIRDASRNLSLAITKVNDSVLSETNLTRLETTLGNLADASGSWKEGSKELDPTIAEAREAIRAIAKAAERAEQTMAGADETLSGLKPAMEKIPRAVDSIARAADKASDALDRAQDGDGLLGTMAYDKDVSTDAKTFVRNLRQHGILRYRDTEPKPEDDPRNRFRGRRR